MPHKDPVLLVSNFINVNNVPVIASLDANIYQLYFLGRRRNCG